MFFPEQLIQQELEKYIHMDRDVMERFIHGEPLNTLEHLLERDYRATVPPGLSRREITQRRIASRDIPPQFVQRSGQFTHPVHRNDYGQSAPYVRLAPTSAEMELGNGDRIRRSPRRHRPRPEHQEFGPN